MTGLTGNIIYERVGGLLFERKKRVDDEKHKNKKGMSSSHHGHSVNSIDHNSSDFVEKLQHMLGLEVLFFILLSILLYLLLLINIIL